MPSDVFFCVLALSFYLFPQLALETDKTIVLA